jgi:hypothetical protein
MKFSAAVPLAVLLLVSVSCDRARSWVARTRQATVPAAQTPAADPATRESVGPPAATPEPALRPMSDDWRPPGVERR